MTSSLQEIFQKRKTCVIYEFMTQLYKHTEKKRFLHIFFFQLGVLL